MAKKTCPRCNKEITGNAPLYQCCRCFTVYCKNCEDSSEGWHCPKCKMSQRLILAT